MHFIALAEGSDSRGVLSFTKNESVQGNRTVVSRSPSQLLKLVY